MYRFMIHNWTLNDKFKMRRGVNNVDKSLCYVDGLNTQDSA